MEPFRSQNRGKGAQTANYATGLMTFGGPARSTVTRYCALDTVLTVWHNPQRRPALGMPTDPLLGSEPLLLAIPSHVEGIHSSLVYFNPGSSFGFTYKGEADIQSTTKLWRWQSIIWWLSL